MGKKAVEMGRYGASDLMKNKKLQKKPVNYGINKLTPYIQDSVGTAMDQLSTKVRPKKKYKTDRKDLDGRSGRGVRGGSRGRMQGVRTPPPEMTCGFLINTVQSASQLYKICFII